VGVPHEEICKYAADEKIDLLVIATHGRTGLERVLMGSVAEQVVRRCSCPVLSVRPEQRAFLAEREQA
jgi:nucleotide-binding universal stress UspA family protein